jgi:predicted MFS family arabinose efflux permease
MLSDLYPRARRSTALAFFTIGGNLGMLFGFLLGGWINQYFGWRMAFVVVGAPGILLALALRFTVTEPVRGLHDAVPAPPAASMRDVLTLLLTRPTLRYLIAGVTLSSFGTYSAVSWSAPMLIRSFALGTAEIGQWFAVGLGIFGMVGSMTAGIVADRLGRHAPKWHLLVPAIASVAMAGFFTAAFTAADGHTALMLLVPPFALSFLFYALAMSVLNSVVPAAMRATASATVMLTTNLLGIGLGAWLIGAASDTLTPLYGPHALRWAMLALIPAACTAAALLYVLASRTLAADLQSSASQERIP